MSIFSKIVLVCCAAFAGLFFAVHVYADDPSDTSQSSHNAAMAELNRNPSSTIGSNSASGAPTGLIHNIQITGESTLYGIFGTSILDMSLVSPTKAIGVILKAIMGLLSVVFVVLILFAGLTWMTAAGNDEKLQKAIGIATFAVIGLVIAISGYVIAYWVFDVILEAGGFGNIF